MRTSSRESGKRLLLRSWGVGCALVLVTVVSACGPSESDYGEVFTQVEAQVRDVDIDHYNTVSLPCSDLQLSVEATIERPGVLRCFVGPREEMPPEYFIAWAGDVRDAVNGEVVYNQCRVIEDDVLNPAGCDVHIKMDGIKGFQVVLAYVPREFEVLNYQGNLAPDQRAELWLFLNSDEQVYVESGNREGTVVFDVP